MEITVEIEKERILSKISKRINIQEYYDIHALTSDEFMEKYGYWGIGYHNHIEIRFYKGTNTLLQLKKLVEPNQQYYFLPIEEERRIYKIDISSLNDIHRNDPLESHFIIADEKLNWIIIKNNFNKLIGIGDYIKKRMKKMVHLSFDNVKIMYCNYDEK